MKDVCHNKRRNALIVVCVPVSSVRICLCFIAVPGLSSSSATRLHGSESAAVRGEEKTVTVTPRFMPNICSLNDTGC